MTDNEKAGAILADVEAEASRIIETANRQGITLRALGGIAVRHHCPSAKLDEFYRKPGDLDLIGHQKQRLEIANHLQSLGYESDKRFNLFYGLKRLLFFDPNTGNDIDIFLDFFQMSHVLPLKERLELEDWTISLTDLLLTKLQIAEINQKDILDITLLFLDHEVVEKEQVDALNISRIATLCCANWGLYTTILDNLDLVQTKLDELVADAGKRETVRARMDRVKSGLQTQDKTLRWKLRSLLGKRIPWYEVPEETRHTEPLKLG